MPNYSTVAFAASAAFTPAATSHTAGDVVGGAKEFVFKDSRGAVPAPGSTLTITSASMLVSGGTQETSTWTLHLYSVTPPSATADDAAFDLPSGDRASYLGSIALSQLVDLGSSLYIEMANVQKQFTMTGSSVFGYLVNGTTATLAAVAHTVTLRTVAS